MMYVLYTDDSILAGPDQKEIEQMVQQLKEAVLDITIEGELTDFLGVNIDGHDDGTIHLTQPHLIHQILKDLRYDTDDITIKTTPGASSRLLSRHRNSLPGSSRIRWHTSGHFAKIFMIIHVRINIYFYNIRFLIRLNDRKGLARASFNTPTHRQWRF
jgi:hypothetical protein